MRRLLCCLIGLLVPLLIGGCTGGGEKQSDVVTIKLVHPIENARTEWEEAIIKPFEQAHPKIHVVLETVPYSLYVAKTMTSIASGTKVGDLLFAEDWFGQELMKKKYAIDLMPFVKSDLNLKNFYSGSFEEWRGLAEDPDDLFAFPAAIGLTVLFYNKDLFDEAGLSYPDSTWTYDTLVRVAQQLTIDKDHDGAPDQYGLLFDPHYTGLETVIYSLGGRTLTADYSRAALTNPRTMSALQFVQDLFLKYKIAPPVSSFINPAEPFLLQRGAMMLLGSSWALNLKDAPFHWDIAVPPKGSDGGRLSRRYSYAFLIPGNSEHPREAWQLLKWVLTKAPAGQFDQLYNQMMPTNRELTSSQQWLDAEPRYNREVLVRLQNNESFPLFTPGWQEWRDNIFTPEMVKMIQGRENVQQFVRRIEPKVNEIIARARQ
jgi:ABC-type glycerol-3-phosphate transport system substrate-binding protein